MFISMRLKRAVGPRLRVALCCLAPALGACAALWWWPAAGFGGAEEGFVDDLDRWNAKRWEQSHGWSNGDWTGCSWHADNIVFDGGRMTLVLDDKGGREHPMACGEYRTYDKYHYGRYEVSMKAARGSGVVSAFFIYTGPPFGDPWHETTIEILGRDTTKVDFTLFVEGEHYPTTVDLGFDAAADFHTYAIEWTPDAIRWSVDGRVLHVDAKGEQPLPKKPGRIFAQIWNAGEGVEDWLGPYRHTGEPARASYDWIRFVSREPKD
jgi:endo-1,3-1,4-beta-glycanase ExoK